MLIQEKAFAIFALTAVLISPVMESFAFTNGQSASIVIGQSNFTAHTAGTSATALNDPFGVAFDSSGNLWVADHYNNRILMYPKGNGFANGAAATIVIGQSNFTAHTAGTNATALNDPFGVAFDSSGNLWVADADNNRVLMYPKGNGFANSEAATIVIGQSNFTAHTAGTNATSLYGPYAIAFDSSGNLWVADFHNYRILMYPKGNGFANSEAATIVIGQSNFTAHTAGTSATALYDPVGVAFDSSGNLWVADHYNNRILMYPKGNGFTNGAAATIVIGQNNFTTYTAGTSATALGYSNHIAFDSSGNLWVADADNNRMLMYPHELPVPEFGPMVGIISIFSIIGVIMISRKFNIAKF